MAETRAARSFASPRGAALLERVRLSRLAWPLLVAAIVLLGATLRFNGLDWDQPAGSDAPLQMHPDERFVSMVSDRIDWPGSVGQYFDTVDSPLNPYNAEDTPSFVYGTLPLFLAKGVSTLAGDDARGPGNGYDRTVVWGRRLAALVDTGTVLVVVGLGMTMFGRRAGGFAGLFYALAVLPTQLAHFWTADPFLVFFAALALLLMVRFVRSQGQWAPIAYGLGAGAVIALSMASKINGALLLPVFVLAVGLLVAVVVVVATSGGKEEVAAAPEACLRDWNADPVSRERGRHVLNVHEYDAAQVGPSEVAGCTVVFPRSAVDPEREYAGFAYTGTDWFALSETFSDEELTELQSRAFASANATITEDGELTTR